MKRSKWKNPIIELRKRVKKKRNTEITPNLIGLTYKVHNGKEFIKIKILQDMVGYKFGEFVSTRAKFRYKKKKKKGGSKSSSNRSKNK